MHFVGVDLAWGGRKPTGLAVLDDAGRLVHLSAVVSDRDLLATLRPYAEGDVVVAVDAPLVVTNATGNRPAEADLNRDFARFDAGAHPVNTGRPGFEESPRGARLAQRLGLEIGGPLAAPVSSAAPRKKGTAAPGRSRKVAPVRRAVEVYPHPATIALFRLGRVLQYKHKPGRDLERLRSELLRLVELLEGLSTATPALHVGHDDTWRALVGSIRTATRKSGLRPAEDEVDAVVCAYVALPATRAPERVTTYGDPATGEIVTPTLPAGHRPTPREPRRATAPVAAVSVPVDPVRAAIDTYAAEHDELVRVTDAFTRVVTSQLDDAGINYLSVTGRAKSVTSFAGKAARTVDGRPVYADPLTEITDQVGIRVITYLHEDVSAVADLLSDEYVVLDDRDMGQETANEGRFGYASRHLLVATGPADGGTAASEALGGRGAQVQIRTVLQHAWAEFEHDIRYKGTIPQEHASVLDRRFTLAAGLLELADREFSAIRDRLQETMTDSQREVDAQVARDELDAREHDPRIDAPDLATFLGGWFTDAGWSRTDHYEWISGLLLELGITSLDELDGLLTSLDADGIDARMGYRYPAGAVRRLDDALLAVYGTRYLSLHGNAHRTELLRARLDKLRAADPTESTDPDASGPGGSAAGTDGVDGESGA